MKKFRMSKLQEAKDFHCNNCKKEKKSKNIATCEGEKLCNGCYGELLSKGEIEKW